MNEQDVAKTVNGVDAVLVALNIARKSDFPWAPIVSPPDLLKVSMNNITKTMEDNNIKRIVTVSAWGVGDSYNYVNWMLRFLIKHTNVKITYAGHEEQEKILSESNLEWTSVRPVGLNNKQKQKGILVCLDDTEKLKMMISRKDVAKFMLDILDDEKYFKTAPGISNI